MNASETHATRSTEQAARAARCRGQGTACRVALVALAALAGCGSRTIVGAGIAHSSGSVARSGTASGIGGGVQIGHYRQLGSGSLGAVVAYDLAGYSSDADGDEILWNELQVRYRHDLRGHGQPGAYIALGPSIGYTLSYLDYVVAGGFFELGYELRLGGPIALDISLRERPAIFMKDDIYGDFHNTFTIGLDLVILGPTSAH